MFETFPSGITTVREMVHTRKWNVCIEMKGTEDRRGGKGEGGRGGWRKPDGELSYYVCVMMIE